MRSNVGKCRLYYNGDKSSYDKILFVLTSLKLKNAILNQVFNL